QGKAETAWTRPPYGASAGAAVPPAGPRPTTTTSVSYPLSSSGKGLKSGVEVESLMAFLAGRQIGIPTTCLHHGSVIGTNTTSMPVTEHARKKWAYVGIRID